MSDPLGLLLTSVLGIIFTIGVGILFFKVQEKSKKKKTCPKCGRRLIYKKIDGATIIRCAGYPKCKYSKIRKK